MKFQYHIDYPLQIFSFANTPTNAKVNSYSWKLRPGFVRLKFGSQVAVAWTQQNDPKLTLYLW
jgi:hypothetical protein